MSLKHKWSILCNNSIIDKETNNLSLINIVDQLTIGVKKTAWEKKQAKEIDTFVVSVPLQIVTLWVKDKGKEVNVEVKYEFVNEKGGVLHTMNHDFKIGKDFKTMRNRTKITNLDIMEEGNHAFIISIKEEGRKEFKKVEEIPLEVLLRITK